ncbi:MAG TPA: MMPL family transporter [Myxococcota bacterium]|nr:MMPL family transporter [Myxococcota bacterium]
MSTFYLALIRHRIAALVALIATTVAFAWPLVPASKLLVDFSLESLLVPDEAARDELAQLHEEFGDDLDLVAILVRLPDGHTVAEPAVLDVITDLGQHLRNRPEVDAARVVTLLDLPLLHSAGAPSDGITPRALTTSTDPLATTRALAAHRSFSDLLIADDLRATLVVAPFSTLNPTARHAMLDELATTLTALTPRLPPGSALMPVGVPLVQASYTRTVLRDILVLVPLTLLIIAILLGFTYRRTHAVIGPLTGVGLGTLWTLGLIQHLGLPFDMVNSVTGVVILVVGVASGAHIVSRHREELIRLAHLTSDSPRNPAIIAAMRYMTPACFVTSATTAVGFAALASAELQAIRHFGLVLAAGVLLAFVAQMLWMPVFLSFVRPDKVLPASDPVHPTSRTHRFLEAFVGHVVARPWRFLSGAGLLALIALFFAMRLHADARMAGELASDHPVAEALAAMESDLSGVLVHAVVVRGQEHGPCESDSDCAASQRCRRTDPYYTAVARLQRAQRAFTDQNDPTLAALEDHLRPRATGLFDEAPTLPGRCTSAVTAPNALAFIADLEGWLEAQRPDGLVSHVQSVLDLALDLDPPSSALTRPAPLAPELIAERLSLLENGAPELTARLLSPDKTRTQVVIRANDIGLAAWRAFAPKLQAEITRLREVHAVTDYEVAITGGSTMAERAISTLSEDLTTSLGWTVLLVLAFITWLVKSLRLGLLALIPNQLPILYTFGLMGALDIPIRASTLVVFSVAFGIAVDDTTHLFHRYREEVLHRGEGRDAVIRSFVATG